MNDLSLGNMKTKLLQGNGQTLADGVRILKNTEEIGGYKVVKLLGSGGMGQVYLAENIQMHKQYALKVLPHHLSQNRSFIDRFRVEARVMADLKHPNIVQVMNIGEDKERNLYYLVMEFISGVTSVGCGPECPPFSSENSNTGRNPSDLEGLLKQKKKSRLLRSGLAIMKAWQVGDHQRSTTIHSERTPTIRVRPST